MAVIDSLGFSVDTSDLRKAAVALNRLADDAEKAGNKSQKSMNKLGRTFDSVKSSIFSLKGAIGALGVSLVFREVLQANEAWTQQTNALKLVTGSAKELAQVQGELFDLAQRTRAATSGTVDLYSRLARSTKELGVSQGQLLSVTETVNKAVAISGSSAESANAALFQLGQGLAAGALRGEELNSVMEQTPRVAQALAEGLGVGIGELRKLGEQGKLTSEVVIAALTNQAAAVDKEFNQTTKTVSQATTQLANEIERTLGKIDNQGLIDAIDSMRKTLSDPALVNGIQTIAQGLFFIVENAIKAAAAVGNLLGEMGTGIGKFAGRLATGVYLVEDSIKATATATEELAQKREQLKLYEDQISALSMQMQSLGTNVPQATLDIFNQKIQDAATTAGMLRGQIEMLETRAAKEPKAVAPEVAAPGAVDIGLGTDEKLQEKLQKRFETLKSSYLSETELALQSFYERQALLDELEANKIGTEEERMALMLESHAQYEAEITAISQEEAQKREKIAKDEREKRIAISDSLFGNLASLTSSGSRRLFEIGKAAALANATVKGYEAVVGAYAEGAKIGGPPLGAAYAATAGVAVAQQIAQIASTSFKGGGSISAPGGGGVTAGGGQPAVSAEPPAIAERTQQPVQEISVVVTGGLHSDEDVRNLIKRVNEVQEDLGGSAKLVVA